MTKLPQMSWTRALASVMGISLIGIGSSVSCIIPDHGIVTLVDCGARWCASAPFAQGLNEDGQPIEVQQANPNGTVGWVTECLCMTPADDTILYNAAPALSYELLRNQILDATRQRCIDVATANGLNPHPPLFDDFALEPDCYEAVTSIYRDGCCPLASNECSGFNTCGLSDPTGGGDSGPSDPTDSGPDSADDTTGEGEMASLDAFYGHIGCTGTTCHIGQPLIDALLHNPEAALAEGTSFALHPTHAPTGLLLQGVEPGGLADRLGLHEGDQILQVDDLPVTTELELLTAAARAHAAAEVTVLVLRDGQTHKRRFVRIRP